MGKRADAFTQDTVRLIGEALELAAKQQELKASGLPREYRTGVSTADIDARGFAIDKAQSFRDAKSLVQALYDRARSITPAAAPRGDHDWQAIPGSSAKKCARCGVLSDRLDGVFPKPCATPAASEEGLPKIEWPTPYRREPMQEPPFTRSLFTAQQVEEIVRRLAASGQAKDGEQTCCDRAYKDGYDTGKMHASGQGVEGWKLVPVVPTQKMLDAPEHVWPPEAKKVWTAMLAAAPTQEKGNG